MSSKLEALKELRKQLDLTIEGLENYPKDAPSLIIANHNCLMDIFYLPASLPEVTVSLISPRLMYKPLPERQEQIDKYLYAMPVEAHGGPVYTKLCLDKAASLLMRGFSASIFPEGAYIKEKDMIHRGRTGMARILFECRKMGIKVHLLPAAIQILNPNEDLDCFLPTDEKITVSILEPINYEDEWEEFLVSSDSASQNQALHKTTDKVMNSIAEKLKRPYDLEYISLRPKGNVIFKSGETVPTEEASNPTYIKAYKQELEERVQDIEKQLILTL